MADLKRGRIVWVELLDPQGRNPKVRPAVILTPTNEITPTGEVQVLAITGDTTAAPAEDCVELPWLATGHPKTGLNKPSVVVVSWTARVAVATIKSVRGHVPATKMIEVLARFTERDEAQQAEADDEGVPPGGTTPTNS